MTTFIRLAGCGVPVVVYLLIVNSVQASNGINLIGFGAESVGMGGADLAIARDSSALNTNPAGLVNIPGSRLDLSVGVMDASGIKHGDTFGNDEEVGGDYVSFISAGVTEESENFTWGIGLFAQGGVGVEYENLETAFGTSDDLSTQFRIVRITPGIAWQHNNRLSFGATLLITHADLEQRFFPMTSFNDTSDPSRSFFGQKLDGANTTAAGYKLGLQYRINDSVRIGAAYTSPTELNLEGGSVRVNMSDAGLGFVSYEKVAVEGIDQPEEFGIGLAWDINSNWLISAELNWINWSKAISISRIKIDDPSNPAAPSPVVQIAEINWDDQYVLAVGGKYKNGNGSVYRIGINIANNPIPDESLSPLLAPITRYHLTAGYGKTLSPEWRFDMALEYAVREIARYTNPQLPFGPDAITETETLAIHTVFTREF